VSRVIRVLSKLPPVVAASGAYYVAYFLVIVAGIISMPIMTRLLTKAEYGLLGLIYSTASVCALIGALGFGEAVVRLYGEHLARGPAALRRLCSTLVAGAPLAAAPWAAVLMAMPSWSAPATSPYLDCLPLAGALVVIRAASGVLYQIYRAQERAVAHASTQVAVRYGTLVLAPLCLIAFPRSAFTVVAATIAVEATALVVRVVDLWRRRVIELPRFDPSILRSAIGYGLPLALAGSARFLLDYADRFLIGRMLGLEAVAIYAVPYDIAAKLGETLSTPIQLAAVPIIFRLWMAEGRGAASRFASDVLTYMIAMSLPLVVLYLVFSNEIILVLASAKYRGAGELTPYILPGVLLGSVNFLIVVGLTIQKRTIVLATGVLGAAFLNILLNLVLIPHWQLVGAAAATTISYAVLVVTNHLLAAGALDLRVDYGVVFAAATATGVSLLVLHGLGLLTPGSLSALAAALSVGMGAAAAAFALLDPRVRRWAAAQFSGDAA
jgi:O-antigen/teichoic acid export membrane protein